MEWLKHQKNKLSDDPRNEIIGTVVAITIALTGWVFALLNRIWLQGNKARGVEDELIVLGKEVNDLRIWRDKFLEDQIRVKMKGVELEQRIKSLEYRRRNET